MTTLAVNVARAFVLGNQNDIPVIASDILYEGSAVGIVDATGHARPLVFPDRFAGFVQEKCDNSTGSAAAKNVRVKKRGVVNLSVSGAVITDVGQPVFATDDNVFIFSPVASVFIGKVIRFVSAGVVDVEFDAGNMPNPYAGRIWEVFSASATLTILHNGAGLWADHTDAQTITLLTYAAATALDVKVVCGGAFGTVEVLIAPAGGDKIAGPGDTGADGGIMANVKVTARRGDYVILKSGGDDGYVVVEKRGIWTIA